MHAELLLGVLQVVFRVILVIQMLFETIRTKIHKRERRQWVEESLEMDIKDLQSSVVLYRNLSWQDGGTASGADSEEARVVWLQQLKEIFF